ncbi:MAG: UDP-N-acetylmuramoyl-L-alanyl-D-glutamate--2,6-diaminopimelate ligase [Akkermansiaceae bacterium]
MKLRQLIKTLPKVTSSGDLDLIITGITCDSRLVQPGYLFIAVRGVDIDGQEFIPHAIEKGASAIVSEVAPDSALGDKLAWLHVSDSRAAMAALACAWYENPSASLKIIGITGTNGKTTSAFIAHAIMENALRRAGLLGTVQVNDGESVVSATHTTPGAIELQAILQTMKLNDCRGVAMEISSHALAQKRTDGLQLDVAVFTNLSQDHLDYHGSMSDYFAAKSRLFTLLESQEGSKKPTAVINLDDPYGQKLVEEFNERLYFLTYGHGVHADLRINREKQNVRGTEIEISFKEKEYLVHTPYIGKFNVMNCAAAMAACIAAGVKPREAVKALADAPQVPGRMEKVGARDGASLFVDYAHTPDALVKACAALRELNPRKLITVFGCGGDRDNTKRPMMGKAASEGSDVCIVTSDNPRSEDPNKIIADITKGMKSGNYDVIVDRDEAIQTAVNISQEGDIILVAGKGHETYQEIAGKLVSFDDRRSGYKALNLKKVIKEQE